MPTRRVRTNTSKSISLCYSRTLLTGTIPLSKMPMNDSRRAYGYVAGHFQQTNRHYTKTCGAQRRFLMKPARHAHWRTSTSSLLFHRCIQQKGTHHPLPAHGLGTVQVFALVAPYFSTSLPVPKKPKARWDRHPGTNLEAPLWPQRQVSAFLGRRVAANAIGFPPSSYRTFLRARAYASSGVIPSRSNLANALGLIPTDLAASAMESNCSPRSVSVTPANIADRGGGSTPSDCSSVQPFDLKRSWTNLYEQSSAKAACRRLG